MNEFFSSLKTRYGAAALLSFAVCAALCAAGLSTRPIFPVDETRYLSVAWEMLERHNYILPTLNFEPYHHKPPVLFWLINLMWSLFGVSQQAAMAVPYLAGFAVLLLTARLSTRIFPGRSEAPLLATAVLAGLFPFVLYSNLIMFDLLLTVFVLTGITAILDYFKTQKPEHLVLLALSVGLGGITKGPVILLHLAPVLVLLKFWMPAEDRLPLKKAAPRLALAVVGGILLGLCWAVPAALEGGKEFAEKIFYGQTAGRMVNAFDHKRSVVWYLPFVPLFFVPWIFAPSLRRGLSVLRSGVEGNKTVRFLLCWTVPVFIAFSLISGKQVHYLLPLLPPIALLITGAFLASGEKVTKGDIIGAFSGIFTLMLLPVAAKYGGGLAQSLSPKSVHMAETFAQTDVTSSFVSLVCAAVSFVVLLRTAPSFRNFAGTVAVLMTMMMVSFQLSARTGFFVNYDLTPLGKIIAENPSRPVAFLGGYNGEFSFLGRIAKPIDILPDKNPPEEWFANHPDGMVVVFTRTPEDFAKYHILYEMKYRLTNTYLLLER